MIKLRDLITERLLTKTKGSVTISFKIDTTSHSDIRKFRHGTEIDDNEVIKTIEPVLDDILNLLIFNELDIEDEICITNEETFLNVICAIKQSAVDEIDLVLLTMIRKKNFTPYDNTYRIYS